MEFNCIQNDANSNSSLNAPSSQITPEDGMISKSSSTDRSQSNDLRSDPLPNDITDLDSSPDNSNVTVLEVSEESESEPCCVICLKSLSRLGKNRVDTGN